MRRIIEAILISGALLATFIDCSYVNSVTVPGELTAEGVKSYTEVGAFEMEVGQTYLLGGLLKISDDKIARSIVGKVKELGGNGVLNLKYEVKHAFFDLCLTGCTLGIYAPMTVVISGTVIKFNGPAASNVHSLESLEHVASGERTLDLPVEYQ